jgi:hypothetical protein
VSQDGERRVEIAVCDKHGLRYNAAEGQGCVRCRREGGVAAPATGAASAVLGGGARPEPAVGPRAGAAGVARPVAPTAAAPPVPGAARGAAAGAERPASGLVQALIAAALVAGTGALFWSLHGEMVAALPNVFGLAAQDAAYEAEGGLPLDEDDDGYADAEPAAYPPDAPGGPADQQRQLDELLREIEDDEARNARGAADAAAEDDGYDDGDEP